MIQEKRPEVWDWGVTENAAVSALMPVTTSDLGETAQVLLETSENSDLL
jgi:hypothetical protein